MALFESFRIKSLLDFVAFKRVSHEFFKLTESSWLSISKRFSWSIWWHIFVWLNFEYVSTQWKRIRSNCVRICLLCSFRLSNIHSELENSDFIIGSKFNEQFADLQAYQKQRHDIEKCAKIACLQWISFRANVLTHTDWLRV